MRACLVARQRIFETLKYFAAIFANLHVDEVDHDDATDVAQSQLAGNFVGGLKVVGEHGFFKARLADVLTCVDVDDGQRFCVFNHERPT